MRQALAGMLWSKQYYLFEGDKWIREHGGDPLLAGSEGPMRNREWGHMFNDDVISMPDKWEYPWYAAWDLAFHGIALAAVDRRLRPAATGPDAQAEVSAPQRSDPRV